MHARMTHIKIEEKNDKYLSKVLGNFIRAINESVVSATTVFVAHTFVDIYLQLFLLIFTNAAE